MDNSGHNEKTKNRLKITALIVFAIILCVCSVFYMAIYPKYQYHQAVKTENIQALYTYALDNYDDSRERLSQLLPSDALYKNLVVDDANVTEKKENVNGNEDYQYIISVSITNNNEVPVTGFVQLCATVWQTSGIKPQAEKLTEITLGPGEKKSYTELLISPFALMPRGVEVRNIGIEIYYGETQENTQVENEGYVSDEKEYEEACQALGNEEYYIAFSYFEELGDYKDAEEKMIQSAIGYLEQEITVAEEGSAVDAEEMESIFEKLYDLYLDYPNYQEIIDSLRDRWPNMTQYGSSMPQTTQTYQNYVQAAVMYKEGSLTNVDEYQKKLFNTINNIGGWYGGTDSCGGSNWIIETNQTKGCITVKWGVSETFELYLQNYGADQIRFIGDGMEIYNFHYGNGIKSMKVKCPKCGGVHEIFNT